MDSEVARKNAWMSVQWLDRAAATPGSRGLPMAAQRFPEPMDDGVHPTVESIDFGPLQADEDLPMSQVSRALITAAGLWLLTRR